MRSLTLNCASIPQSHRPLRIVSMAAKINTEQLRSQLDQLHIEADKTRAKANNARLRLMRLSEAAEKLRRQAAVDVRVGKENEARELLVQKQKVMRALEKSKGRIELLDQLSAKLNEAISMKETQLIGNVALDLEDSRESTSPPIRIISPKEDNAEHSEEREVIDPVGIKYGEDQEVEFQNDCQQTNIAVDHQQEGMEGGLGIGIWNEEARLHSLKGISSYRGFLEYLDQQLNEIEVELVTVLRISTMVMESEQKQKNPKVQQTLEILEAVCGIRRRIASIVKARNDSRQN